jgi:hypothetical protein
MYLVPGWETPLLHVAQEPAYNAQSDDSCVYNRPTGSVVSSEDARDILRQGIKRENETRR